jgi:hypothetical protein
MTKANGTRDNARTANIVLAIVGLTVVNSTFIIPMGICANVRLAFKKPHHRQ